MRQLLILCALLLSSATFANVCPYVYSSGWYCDTDGYAVYCSYDSYYDEYYESDYIACPAAQNSYGCLSGECLCSNYCAHGTQNDDCSCNCPYPWGGMLCNSCLRSNSECGNNGYMNQATCQCSCPSSCLHGGTQDANCGCSCPSPWSGQRCEVCTRSSSECANGGYMDPQTCQCVCPNKCQNGGVQNANCGCSCPSPWTGALCQTCTLTQANCNNNATFDSSLCQCNCVEGCQHSASATRTCGCNCVFPWTGSLCETCSFTETHCLNNGNFTGPSTCNCDCTTADNCENGGTRMADLSCGCNCVNGWGGNNCANCMRDASFCLGNSSFVAPSCNCNCTGEACAHGRLNERCQCLCDAGFKGTDCSVRSSARILMPSVFLIAAILVGYPLLGN